MEFNQHWNIYLKALYFDRQGDWESAHNLVDGHPGKTAAHIHAYLHRKEGDEWNAGYWYRNAGKEFFNGSLDEEWNELWNYYRNYANT